MPAVRLRLFGGVEVLAHEEGRETRLSLAPKPLALLAYLAVGAAEDVPVRRDVLLALFWPELPTDRARAALRQLLFQLRRAVGGAGLSADREAVSLDRDMLSCDVATFEERLASGDRVGAMEVYRGPLLDGFFVDDASAALEEWMANARARLSAKAFAACTALADEAEWSENGVAAARWARAAAALAPDDEIAIRRLIRTLVRFGDRAGALRVADDFAQRLAAEFDTAPSAETQALFAAIRTPRERPIVVDAPASLEARRAPSTAPIMRPVAASGERAAEAAALVRHHGPASGRRALFATLVATVVVVAVVETRRADATSGPGMPAHAMAPPITVSAAARGLYLQGLARYDVGDGREAARLLNAALAADGNCAMCAYYSAMANVGLDDSASEHLLLRANRLADRVSEPERLLIHYRWADVTNSFARGVIADSLVARYPEWPEAQTAAAGAAISRGEWLVAADHLRRAVAAEPIPATAASAPCPACATRLLLITTYQVADSLAAVLRVAQAFVREQPHSRLAWLQLSHALAASGRFTEARSAMDSSTRYASGTVDDVTEHAAIEIRARNFATADGLLATLAQTGNGDARRDALWGLIISLRAQGRLHEALALTQGEFRRVNESTIQDVGLSRAAEAQVYFELGRYRQAAAIFEGAATLSDSFSKATRGPDARQHAWMLTQAGSAVAAAGDTVALAKLIESVRRWGLESGFGRDHLLHYYLTGLLWTARGRADSAAVAFARATISETDGFSRLNIERARALVALGRPEEAIPVLRHALAGPLEGGNFYATATDLEEGLALAYDAAGEADSAATYYQEVLTSWRNADPQFRPRLARARERLAVDARRLATEHRLPAPASPP